MKTIITVLTMAVVLGTPIRAQAINKEWSAALGFLGGYLVASSVHGAPVYHERVYVTASQAPVYHERVYVTAPQAPVYHERVYVTAPQAPVVYPMPSCVPASTRQRPMDVHRSRGHYEHRRQRVWVPGRWVHEPCHRGHGRRVWEPGYHRYETVRVWVESTYAPEW